MKIHPVSKADLPGWLGLRKALWPHCSEAEHAREARELLDSDGITLLAKSADGQAVGFAEVSIRKEYVEGVASSPVAYLEGWYVHPDFRRRGIGRALIEAVVEWAMETGFSELASDAEMENRESIQAHLRLGFRETGRIVHFVRSLRVQNS